MLRRAMAISLLIFILCSANAFTLEKPQWKEGDYWQYVMKIVGSEKGEMLLIEVLDKENLTINNITYSCIVVKTSGIVDELYYYDEETFAVVKKVIYRDTKSEEIVYAAPQSSIIQYPIFIGKKWNATVVDYKNSSVTLSIECTGTEKVATKAGSFNCYVIKADYVFNETDSIPYLYQIIYLSDRVGNMVKTEMYQNDTLVGYTELISFHYSGYMESKNHIVLIAATIVASISILVAAFYFLKLQK